jgi:hypothetical protein
MHVLVSTAIVIVFCVLFFPTALVAILPRWGEASPRFGRWLDGRIYRALPRLEHLFVEGPEEEQSAP